MFIYLMEWLLIMIVCHNYMESMWLNQDGIQWFID